LGDHSSSQCQFHEHQCCQSRSSTVRSSGCDFTHPSWRLHYHTDCGRRMWSHQFHVSNDHRLLPANGSSCQHGPLGCKFSVKRSSGSTQHLLAAHSDWARMILGDSTSAPTRTPHLLTVIEVNSGATRSYQTTTELL
jgi:hypothetical protein